MKKGNMIGEILEVGIEVNGGSRMTVEEEFVDEDG